jgi:hypothetical protein
VWVPRVYSAHVRADARSFVRQALAGAADAEAARAAARTASRREVAPEEAAAQPLAEHASLAEQLSGARAAAAARYAQAPVALPPQPPAALTLNFATAAADARRAGYTDAEVQEAGQAIRGLAFGLRSAAQPDVYAPLLASLDMAPQHPLASAEARGALAFSAAATASAFQSCLSGLVVFSAAEINEARRERRAYWATSDCEMPDFLKEEHDLPEDEPGGGDLALA